MHAYIQTCEQEQAKVYKKVLKGKTHMCSYIATYSYRSFLQTRGSILGRNKKD